MFFCQPMTRWVGHWCALIWLCTTSWVSAQEPLRITVQSALERVDRQHPALKASRSQVRQAHWGVQKASSLPSASLNLGTWQGRGAALLNANYLGEERADAYLTLSQSFLPWGSAATRRQVAQKEVDAAQQSVEVTRLRLNQQVKDQCFTLVAQEQLLAVAESNLQVADEIFQVAQIRFEAGSGSQLDVNNARVERNRAAQQRESTRAALLQQQARLSTQLGYPSDQRLSCSDALEFPLVALEWNELQQKSLGNPVIKLAEENLARVRQEVDLAGQQNNPTPSVVAVFDAVRPSYAVQLQLSIPIDWGAVGNDVRQKEELVQQLEAELESARRGVSAELKAAWENFQVAQANARSYPTQVLQTSEEAARVTRYGYSRGALPYLQVLTSQQNLANIRREQIQLLLSARLALHALEAAVGHDLSGGAR